MYGSDYSALILPRLLSTLDRTPAPSKRIVDVACGTGTLALVMARRGWQASGVDASPGMIDASRRKAVEFGQPVRFFCQDMRSFVVPERAGLVTSFYDSVNHLLTLRDVRGFFRSASRALESGGLLIFDVNNEACYRKLWKGITTIEHADFTLVLNNSYAPSRSIARSRVLVHYHGVPPRSPGTASGPATHHAFAAQPGSEQSTTPSRSLSAPSQHASGAHGAAEYHPAVQP